MEFVAGDGFNHPLLRRSGPYDLVLANILARPLKRLAPDIRKARLQLEYQPNVDLDDGLKRFLDWSDGVYTGEQ